MNPPLMPAALRLLASRIPVSFWRFALVGIGGLLVDVAVLYWVLWAIGWSVLPSRLVSFLAAATFTWWFNRQYTFGKSDKSLFLEWGSFLATNAFGGLVNLSVYTAVVTQFPAYPWLPAVATGMGSLSGLLFNYLSSKHLVFNQVSKQEVYAGQSSVGSMPPFPKLLYGATLCVSLGFGLFALWLGMDASWDLRNYHWYNGWAFLHGATGKHWLVSQLASFYNPLADVPYVWLALRLPARAVGFTLGALHGLNFLPLSAIAWRLSTLGNLRHRLYFSALIALAGLCGAGGLSEVGLSFFDNLFSLGVLCSILLALVKWDEITLGRGWQAGVWAVLAGLPAGLAFGFKYPMAVYGAGLAAGFLAVNLAWVNRIKIAVCVGVGVLAGYALTGGYWAVHLWQSFGNPFFPFFNQWFHSPWAVQASYVNETFVPQGLSQTVGFLFRFSFDSGLAGEAKLSDFRVLVLAALSALAAALALLKKRQAHPFTHPQPTRWLLAVGLIAFALWVPLFSVYRYLVPLEMLAPLLSVAAVGLLPLAKRLRLGLAFAVLAVFAMTTKPGHWGRVSWQAESVPVMLPPAPALAQSMVLLTGFEPLSFIVPSFPPTTQVYRIQGGFKLPDDPNGPFKSLLRNAIQSHQGPLYSLHVATEVGLAVKHLAEHGLVLDQASCQEIYSPIGFSVYQLCRVVREGGKP